jgi:hypothetical protein
MIGRNIHGEVDTLNRVRAHDERSHGGIKTPRCACG